MSATEIILGIHFFNGTVEEAVEEMSRDGGLLVVPAAPALVKLQSDEAYRHALTSADMAIADSGAMVLLWRFRGGRRLMVVVENSDAGARARPRVRSQPLRVR